jgi:hypothetical protein
MCNISKIYHPRIEHLNANVKTVNISPPPFPPDPVHKAGRSEVKSLSISRKHIAIKGKDKSSTPLPHQTYHPD